MEAIVISNLSKSFGNIKAVDEINLSVYQDKLFSLQGTNGQVNLS